MKHRRGSKGLERITGEFKYYTKKNMSLRGRQDVCCREHHVAERVGNSLGSERRMKLRVKIKRIKRRLHMCRKSEGLGETGWESGSGPASSLSEGNLMRHNCWEAQKTRQEDRKMCRLSEAMCE